MGRVPTRLVREERGFTLVFVLGVLIVTSVAAFSIVEYSSSGQRTSSRSKADDVAYSLAEAGVNNALSTLSNPSNNALQQSTLPSTEAAASSGSYEGGTAEWWGVLSGSTWTIYGKGTVANPTGPGSAPVTRRISASVTVQPSLTQTLNNDSWNYILVKNTAGSPCDVTFANSVQVDTSLFILGDLCFANSAKIVAAAAPNVTNLVVGGNVIHSSSQNSVGSAGAKINEAHVGGTCTYNGGAAHSPCSGADEVWATTYFSTAPAANAPAADFDYWYANAKPGPEQFCTNGGSGLATTTFENEIASPTRNTSAGTFDLTPGSSYDCQYRDASNNLLGQLKWDNAAKTLTVSGVIYIDGNVTASDGVTNSYNGQASLYASGTFTLANGTQLCAGVLSGNCDVASWNPNTELLGIMADGNITISNSARWQGALYSTGTVSTANSAQLDGPIVGGGLSLANSVQAHEFPTIMTVPIGWPGNPTIYAQPQPPTNFSG